MTHRSSRQSAHTARIPPRPRTRPDHCTRPVPTRELCHGLVPALTIARGPYRRGNYATASYPPWEP